jgi:hypothetical protein
MVFSSRDVSIVPTFRALVARVDCEYRCSLRPNAPCAQQSLHELDGQPPKQALHPGLMLRARKQHIQIIRDEIAAGTRSSCENLSGVTPEPGYLAAAARGHNVRRAVEHGVNLKRVLATGALPHNIALLTFAEASTAPSIENH